MIASLNLVAYTSADGRYRLVVPGARAQGQQVALTARMIGHRQLAFQVTLTPGATIEQNFQLVGDPLRLDEIVVTGAGTEQLAERLGTARSSVDAVEVQRANETNVVQALAGKIPNVVTNQASGDAGASTAIQIRGAKTFGTSQPVIFVDGVPISNQTRGQGVVTGIPSPNRAADINPEDIESIEVLKGAAATSIYGASAGSAGAILITTKRGRPGRTTYSLRSSLQFDEPVRTVPVQRRFGQLHHSGGAILLVGSGARARHADIRPRRRDIRDGFARRQHPVDVGRHGPDDVLSVRGPGTPGRFHRREF